MNEVHPIRTVQYLSRIDERDGGVVRFVLNFCDDLARRGHQVTLLTQDDRDVPAAWRDAGGGKPQVVTAPLPTNPVARLSDETNRTVDRLLAESQLLHLHCLWDPANIALASHCRAAGVPYVVSAHGMLNDWALRLKRLKKLAYLAVGGKKLLRQAARVHCASNGERQQVAEHLPDDNLAVVPLSFDGEAFGQLPGADAARARWPVLADNVPAVLSLGRLHPVKRYELLVDALAILHNEGVEAHLLLAGPAEEPTYLAQLERQIASLGLSRSVHFLGTVTGAEKVSLYQACDVFALASWQECFGIVLAEALAAETPIVTTRSVDTWPELQRAGGVIVDDNSAAFAAALNGLLRDSQERRALGEQGRKYVLDWLEPDRVLAAWEDVYRGVL